MIDKIIVIAAHPDDEVLGCGATIAKYAQDGHIVCCLILGEGITSRDAIRDRQNRESEINTLKTQIHNANNILGVKKIYTFDFPDNRFDTVPLLDIIKTIESVKNELRPNIIFTHHHGDLNIDHQITYKAVLTAFRPMKEEPAREIYSFEIPSSTEWSGQALKNCFLPNCYIDVSATIGLKIAAMKEYKSEIREYPHPRSIEAIELAARFRGFSVGVENAEAFEIVRILK